MRWKRSCTSWPAGMPGPSTEARPSMPRTDLLLLHPPSVFKFRELPLFFGPVSDVVPSSSIFEIYPIGFLTMSEYLTRHNVSVRIDNIALKMLRDRSFDPGPFVKQLHAHAFG